VKDLRLLAPLLACCGVKLLLVGALFAPAGLLSGNVLLGIAGLAVAVLLVALAVRSRRRCDGSCHAPTVGAGGSAHRHDV
jgi:galactitol-specific phosphotransferase system IIC component